MSINGCKNCGICCKHYPCATHPEDILKIANFLKMNIKECLLKYFISDYYATSKGNIYYICPKRKNDKKNWANYSWAFSNEPCIFLENNKCTIHPIKPKGGKLMKCWMDDIQYSKFESATDYKSDIGIKYLKILNGEI